MFYSTREGSMSLEKNIQDVLQLQDVELANAMNALKSDGAKLSDFINSRKASLYNTVTNEHSDNFEKTYNDFVRASEGTKNILYYHTRNKDLDRLQQEVFARAKGEAEAATYDSQTAKRQFEVNEWTANNKMDTLFVFQMVFITLTLTAPLLYLSKTGVIPTSITYMLFSLLCLAIILTLVVRIQYNTQSRSNRFWNRRRFAQIGGPPTLPTCEAIRELEGDIKNKFNQFRTSAQDISGQATDRLSAAYNALTA
jgi:hypothetical protein